MGTGRNGPMNKLITSITVLVFVPTIAFGSCDVKDFTKSTVNGVVEQVRNIERNVYSLDRGVRVCSIGLEAKINGKWVDATDNYTFGPDMTENDACSMALDKAKLIAVKVSSPEKLNNTTTVNCGNKPGPVTGQWERIDDKFILPWLMEN